MTAIQLKSITHSYNPGTPESENVLEDLNLTWSDGGAYALLGPSGCGKSTLLNIISGLVRPTSGSLHFNDVDVTDAPTAGRNIAQVFQFPVVYDNMSIYDNLAFPLRNQKRSKSDVHSRVMEVAELLEIKEELSRSAGGLTPDIKQIISLARGLVREDVAAILFDEPLTVIDPALKWLLRRKLKQVHAQFKTTLIYVTHDQTEALTFADEVVVMRDGQILQKAEPARLYSDPAHTFVGYFIGSPGMNFIDFTFDGRNALLSNGVALSLPDGIKASIRQNKEKLKLGIRPPFFEMSQEGTNGALPLKIKEVQNLGNFKMITALLGETPIKIQAPENTVSRSGETSWFRLRPEGIKIYANDWALPAHTG